jgi:hypothetical protein
MPGSPTEPRIFDAQNTTDARSLVAAQSRMYSDAKIVSAVRLSVVVGLAIAAGVVAVLFPSLRIAVGGLGGAAVLVVSLVVGSVENRLRTMAVMTQELFDTRVFGLAWNGVTAERPSGARIAKAASRYRGSRAANWYDDTEDMHRPYDVLSCQAANLGWGASMHRLWAYLLCVMGVFVTAAVVATVHLAGLSWSEMIPAVIIPALAPIKELYEQVSANLANGRSKETAERKISDLWAEGMQGTSTPTEAQLRAVQDKLLHCRQENAYVPDWLDKVFHSRNQAAMRASVQSRIHEARRHGHA